MVDRRDGAAVAQVARDEAQIAQRPSEQVRRLLGRVAVTRAVGAVAADAVIIVVAPRQWVHVGLRRHGGVEGSVEHGHLGHLGHQLAHHVDTGVGRRVVQRCQLLALRQVLARRVVNEGRLGEIFAAGHDAIAHAVDLAQVADGALRIVHEHFQQLAQALLHGHAAHVVGGLIEIGREGHVHVRLGRAHLLSQALHERHLAVSLDKLALQRRRPRIHHQYAHRFLPRSAEARHRDGPDRPGLRRKQPGRNTRPRPPVDTSAPIIPWEGPPARSRSQRFGTTPSGRADGRRERWRPWRRTPRGPQRGRAEPR